MQPNQSPPSFLLPSFSSPHGYPQSGRSPFDFQVTPPSPNFGFQPQKPPPTFSLPPISSLFQIAQSSPGAQQSTFQPSHPPSEDFAASSRRRGLDWGDSRSAFISTRSSLDVGLPPRSTHSLDLPRPRTTLDLPPRTSFESARSGPMHVESARSSFESALSGPHESQSRSSMDSSASMSIDVDEAVASDDESEQGQERDKIVQAILDHSLGNDPDRLASLESFGHAIPSDSADKREGPWTEAEHNLFLYGISKYGWGKWREIAQNVIKTRTRVQVATHGHKFLSKIKRSKSSSGKKAGSRSPF